MKRAAVALVLVVTAALLAAWLYEPATVETPPGPRDLRFLEPAPRPLEPGADTPRASECTTVLRARFLDPSGHPVAGVRFACAWPRASATSGDDGRATLAMALLASSDLRTLHLRASASGYANVAWTARARDAELTDLGDILLGPAGRVRGRVVDESGLPLAAAEVRAAAGFSDDAGARLHGPVDPVAAVATDANGEFEIEGVPVGPVRIWAGSPTSYWCASDPFELAAGARVEGLTLVVRPIPPENVLEIEVVDPEGQPVSGATILYRRAGGRSPGSGQGVADENGRWRLVAEDRVPHELRASDIDGALRPARVSGALPGSGEVVLALGRPVPLRIVVRDESGAGIERYRLEVRELAQVGNVPSSVFLPRERAGGELELALPLEPFTLALAADGFREASFGPFDPAQTGSEISVALAALPKVSGIVHHDGEPIVGAHVSLHRATPSGLELTVNGFPARCEPVPAATGTTNERGEFALPLPAAGEYVLRAEATGWCAMDAGPIPLQSDTDVAGLHLELARGGTLEGSVRVDPGESLEGRIVALSRGDGLPFTVRTDAQGRFRVEHVTPGPWWIGPAERELVRGSFQAARTPRATPAVLPSNASVEDGLATSVVVSFEVRLRTLLRGELALGGRPCGDWQVQVTRADAPGRVLRRAALDSSGRFELGTPEPGVHVLSFHDPARGAEVLTLDCAIELAEGEQRWQLDLPIGRVQGRLATLARREDSLEWRAEPAAGIAARGRLQPDDDGSFLLPRVPAGEVRILRRSTDGELDLRRFTLPERATFDLGL